MPPPPPPPSPQEGTAAPYVPLTEEEIELLADYGTRDARDALLPDGAVRDASALTSAIGTRGLFLTGTDDGAGEGGGVAGGDGHVDDVPALIDMPLDLFVLRAMGMGMGGEDSSSSAANLSVVGSGALSAAVADAVAQSKQLLEAEEREREGREGKGDVQQSSSSGGSAAPSSAYADPFSNMDAHADDADVLRALDAMVAEADAEIASLARRDYRNVPDASSEGLRLARIMFGITDDTIKWDGQSANTVNDGGVEKDKDDNEEEEEDPFADLPPANAAHEAEEAAAPPLLSAEEEAQIEAAVEQRLAAQRLEAAAGPAFAPLYDGEGAESIQRRIDEAHHDEDLRRRRAAFSELAVKTVRAAVSAEDPTAIAERLRSVGAAATAGSGEGLAAKGRMAVTADVLAMAAEHAAEADEEDEDGRIEPIVISAQSSVHVPATTNVPVLAATADATLFLVDRLVPADMAKYVAVHTATAAATADVAGGVKLKSTSGGDKGIGAEIAPQPEKPETAATHPPAAAEATATGKKRRQRAAWVLSREAAERAAMLTEDNAAARLSRHLAAKGLVDARAREALEAAEAVGRREALGEEGFAAADLWRREAKQRGHLADWARHMAELAKAKAAADVDAEEAATREAMEADWARAIEDVGLSRSRHLASIEQNFARRRALDGAAGTAHLSLLSDEADAWGDLLTFHCREESREALRIADRAAEARRKAMEEAAKRHEERRAAVEALAERPLSHLLGMIDVEGLREAVEAACRRVLANRRRQGGIAVSGRVGTPPPPRAASQGASASFAGPSPAGDDGVVLTADTFRELLEPSFALLRQEEQQQQQSRGTSQQQRYPSRLSAAAAFRTVSLALEHITAIDHNSLAQLSVGSMNGGGNTQSDAGASALSAEDRRPSSSAVALRLRGLVAGAHAHGGGGVSRQQHVCPLVRHLDLSNNSLQSLDCEGLLGAAFGSLRRIVLAGNALTVLDGDYAESDTPPNTAGGAEDSSAAPLSASASLTSRGAPSDFPRLVQLDASANKLSSLSGVQRFSFLTQLSAYGNRLTSLPSDLAARCPLLSVVEISRNELTDLSPLSGLKFLQSIDCGRNRIASLDPIARSAPLLQRLYASHNSLTALPRDACWVFLQHLFVSDNAIEHLNGLSGCPLLTVLSAESNKLVDVEGLRCCPFLASAALSFNALEGLEALLPLGYCPLLERLSINDNPVMMTGSGSGAGGGGVDQRLALAAAHVLCPQLRELNNDAVTPEGRSKALGGSETAAPSRGEGPYPVEAELETAVLPWRTVREKQKRRQAEVSGSKPATPACPTATAAMAPLVAFVRREYSAVTLHYSRQVSRAAASEGRLLSALRGDGAAGGERGGSTFDAKKGQKGSGGVRVWGTFRDSSEAFVDQCLGTALLLSRHYQMLLLAAARSAEEGATNALADTLIADPVRAALDAALPSLSLGFERGAREIVGRFLVSRIRIGQAKRQLAALRATTTLYSDRATKIQSVFRGHRVRRALRGVGTDDDDDMAMYTKVDAGLLGPSGAASHGGVGAVMRSALQTHGAAPVFEVRKAPPPSDALAPASMAAGGAPTRLGSAPQPSNGGLAGRGSATAGGTLAGALRPSSQPLMSPSGVLHPSPPRAAPSTADPSAPPTDEWSAAIRLHLHKKTAKVAKQQAEVMRREFVNDPLRARQMKK